MPAFQPQPDRLHATSRYLSLRFPLFHVVITPHPRIVQLHLSAVPSARACLLRYRVRVGECQHVVLRGCNSHQDHCSPSGERAARVVGQQAEN